MAFDRFLISNYSTGLQKDKKPWKIMDDAFELLKNAYIFRGRVRKRFGSYLMGPTRSNPLTSRLRINIGNTPGPLNIPGTATNTLLQVGQIFSVGSDIFTVYQLGANVATLATNGATSATINSTVNPNTVTIVGEPGGTAVYWYPSFPVMGLTQYESGAINDYPSYAFDPYFAYVFIQATGWVRSGTGTAPLWNGQLDTTFMNFFWVANWKGIIPSPGSGSGANIVTMFVTNFQVTNKNGVGAATDDPIWFTSDGNTWTKASGANGFYFLPGGGAPQTGPFVQTARIIVPFRNRLILLNTIENDNSGGSGVNSWYSQRCRYSFNGNPFAVNAWYEPGQSDNAGLANSNAAGAGFIDASTDEQIISAEFIKDRLIVYFERSTWELSYTGNEQLPFIWNKLNTELGSQSTFSTVPFDKAVLTIGNTGVHSCNGSNVERIDQIIPDEIFNFVIKNNNAVRIAGVRDYRAEMVYWAVPYDDKASTQTFPNRILVYNYRTPSWSYNDDTFTAFGYFEQSSDVTWQSLTMTWAENNDTWESNVTPAQQIQILAGNQEGFVVIIDPTETSTNSQSLQITNLTNNGATINLNVINHNLSASNPSSDGDWVAVYNSGMTNFDVNYLTKMGIYPVVSVIDANNITIQLKAGQVVSGTYNGGGTLARVSNIQMQSKQWNPYDKEDRNVYLQRIDFAVQKTTSGQITVDYWPSSSEVSMLQSGTAIMGTGILETTPYNPVFYPLEQAQTRLWHPLYFQSDGECIQLDIYLSDAQMADPNIAFSDFELEAMLLFVERTTSYLQ